MDFLFKLSESLSKIVFWFLSWKILQIILVFKREPFGLLFKFNFCFYWIEFRLLSKFLWDITGWYQGCPFISNSIRELRDLFLQCMCNQKTLNTTPHIFNGSLKFCYFLSCGQNFLLTGVLSLYFDKDLFIQRE